MHAGTQAPSRCYVRLDARAPQRPPAARPNAPRPPAALVDSPRSVPTEPCHRRGDAHAHRHPPTSDHPLPGRHRRARPSRDTPTRPPGTSAWSPAPVPSEHPRPARRNVSADPRDPVIQARLAAATADVRLLAWAFPHTDTGIDDEVGPRQVRYIDAVDIGDRTYAFTRHPGAPAGAVTVHAPGASDEGRRHRDPARAGPQPAYALTRGPGLGLVDPRRSATSPMQGVPRVVLPHHPRDHR